MADFQHYATEDEGIDIVRDVVRSQKLRLIPNHPVFEKPHVAKYAEINAAAERELRQAHSALLEGEFTVTRLQFMKRGDVEQTYYLDAMSGPRLRWSMPREGGGPKRILAPGSLVLLKSYLDPATGDWATPDETLKGAYKDIIAAIKKRMVRVPIRKGDAVWVGRHTKELLDQHVVRIER